MYRNLSYFSFFPNGGRKQPECNMDLTGFCSHQCAYKYFSRSLNEPIHGYLCGSREDALTGQNCSTTDTAIFGGEPGGCQQ